MRKYLIFFILFVLSNNLFSQKTLPVLIDTVMVVKIFSFSSDNKTMSIDDYFIYKNQLYNNFISSDFFCSKNFDFIQTYRLQESIKKSKFYKKLMTSKEFKRMAICDFTLINSAVFCTDTACLNKNNCTFKDCYVYFKKEIIMFSLISCDLQKSEIGNSVHYKFLENFLFPYWKGAFLIPLAKSDAE
jgi:hypothetical protein